MMFGTDAATPKSKPPFQAAIQRSYGDERCNARPNFTRNGVPGNGAMDLGLHLAAGNRPGRVVLADASGVARDTGSAEGGGGTKVRGLPDGD